MCVNQVSIGFRARELMKCLKTWLEGSSRGQATSQDALRTHFVPGRWDYSHLMNIKYSWMCFPYNELFYSLKCQPYCQQRVLWEELHLNFARTGQEMEKKPKKQKKNHFSHFILPCLADFPIFSTSVSCRLGLVALSLSLGAMGLSGAEATASLIVTWKQECLNHPETWRKKQAFVQMLRNISANHMCPYPRSTALMALWVLLAI